jgi:hypothetical protein
MQLTQQAEAARA